MGLPEDLSKQELEFWSWLTNSHILPDPLEFSPSRRKKNYRLVSTDEIRPLIADAFQKGDSQLADNLLEIASKQQITSDEIIRKSSRLKIGEYLKLLYIKILEETSFSDVIVKILTPYSKKYLDEFSSKWKTQLTNSNDKIEHLYNLIKSWDEMSPESRTRAVDMGLQGYEGKKEVFAEYPYKLDEVKEFLPMYFFSELDRLHQFDDGSEYIKRPRVYEYFENKWRMEIDEYPIGKIWINVSVDEQDHDILFFKPVLKLLNHLNTEEQLDLFEKYGERDVLNFVNLFKIYPEGEENQYQGSFEEDGIKDISFRAEIPLPVCSVKVEGADNFNPRPQEDSIYEENLYRVFGYIKYLIKSLGESVDFGLIKLFEGDDQKYGQIGEEYPKRIRRLQIYLRSNTWGEFFKIATRLAKPEDFLTIKKINLYRNRILNYFKVETFVTDLVYASITHRSVVSYYVGKDVWRFLPIMLKEQDWYNIANSYLSNL
jgi:hypothetical protein